MRLLILAAITATLTACDPGTPLGNILHPDKPRDVSLITMNQSSRPVDLTIRGSESLDEDQCKPYAYDDHTDSIASGQTITSEAHVKCPLGDYYRWLITVKNGNFNQSFYVYAAHVTGNVQCTDATCVITLICDGAACVAR